MARKNEFDSLIQEKETVELKSSLSLANEIVEVVCAFANTKGGKVVAGVNNSGKVLGIKIESVSDKKIIIIEVKKSLDKLVFAFGRPFKRVGKSTRKMNKDEYESLILEKHKDKLQFDKDICKEASPKDIDSKKVEAYLKLREKNHNI